MKKQSFAAFIATALIATATLSHATLAGMPSTDGTLFATFDVFPSANFTGAAPTQSDTGLFTATLDNAFTGGQGGVLTGSGDRLYSGVLGPGTPSAFNLTFDGIAAGTISTLSLQLKYTAPSVGAAADFFTVSLTGVGSGGTPAFLGTVTEGANTFSVYQWTWTGLNITSGSSFEITANSFADHVSLDTARVTNTAAEAIPEPSTYALIVLGLGAVVIASRARRIRA
jgi:hypothetical protein